MSKYAMIWVSHEGRGVPYVAVDGADVVRSTPWAKARWESLPGVSAGASGMFGSAFVAKATDVGLWKGHGSFQIRFGFLGSDAEQGTPTWVEVDV